MKLDLNVTLSDTETKIVLPAEQLQLTLTDSATASQTKEAAVCLLFDQHQLTGITTTPLLKRISAPEAAMVQSTSAQLDQQDLALALTELTNPSVAKQPTSDKAAQASAKTVLVVLSRFGYHWQTDKPRKKAGKPQHKWSKELATVPFYLDYGGATATVFWQKRNQMLVQAGAQLQPEVPLNKDGSVGFSARFAQKLRSEHQAAIAGTQTKTDVILKSPNEVGLFLYFGGTNCWLQLKDETGRTLADWSQTN